jgi:hypothetical protein
MRDLRWLGIIAGAIIIGAAIVAAQFVNRYRLASGVSADGTSIVWRVDAHSGDVEMCRFVKQPIKGLVGKFIVEVDGPTFSVQCTKNVSVPPSPAE